MRERMILLAALALGVALPGAGRAQPEASLRHLANEGVLLRLPECTVLIDGLFGDGLPEYPSVGPATRDSLERATGGFGEIDLLLVTHVHRDHFDAGAVERHLLANPEGRLVASRQVADSLRVLGSRFEAIRGRVHAVDATPDRTTALEVAGIPLRAFGIAHPPSRNEPVEHLAYVVGAETPVAHLGDLGLESAGFEMLEGPVAIALAPYWVLTREGSGRIAAALEARCLAGFHVAIGGVERARRQLAERAPAAVLLDGQSIPLAACRRGSAGR